MPFTVRVNPAVPVLALEGETESSTGAVATRPIPALPRRLTACGPPGASSSIVSTPTRVPSSVGVKVT